ncbi:E3 ubiquitin-protein ligase BOI [Arachis duranensis]|uniref:E3 ubiquitin-protein ligase BOI n=1 Tax=Arachis duranensis TaxID=130453 RepID=A0A6P4D751_ARADU|nr:E3 ubiquitin-protein ligase BOI [Arachis duranensis]
MAVQAQYPSNLLLLNTNNSNNNDDYSSALQPPHQLSRKRPRQPTPIPIPNNLMNQFNPPPPPPQQQQHQNQNVVSTGLRLSFSSQQRLQWQQTSSLLSQQLADQIKQQRHEIDQFLQAQGEQLRRSLADKRHNHFRALITAAEDTLARRLRDKETEVQKATRRNAELEARAAHLTAEAQLWQAKAKAQEATAASLQAQLHHAIMNAACGGGAGAAGTADDAAAGVMSEMHFRACPVCLTVKNSTVEVYLS